jgi:hypothetical protein
MKVAVKKYWKICFFSSLFHLPLGDHGLMAFGG